jgi:hypothetical protein
MARRCHAAVTVTFIRERHGPQSTEEEPMSNPADIEDTTTAKGVKTIGIRLDPDIHAQLTLIAGLRGSTITDEIKTALHAHIAGAKDAADLANRADEALAEIERDAAARRDAIATLFGDVIAAPSSETPASGGSARGRSRKATAAGGESSD